MECADYVDDSGDQNGYDEAVADLDAWASERSFESTSDPEYAEQHSADSRAR